jgi:hypothetical protein
MAKAVIKSTNKPREPILLQCLYCGKPIKNTNTECYKSVKSTVYNAYKNAVPIHKTCVQTLFETWISRYKDEKIALMLVCFVLDKYFDEEKYENFKSSPNFNIGNYFSQERMGKDGAYRNNTFINNILQLLDGTAMKSNSIEEESEEDSAKQKRLSKKWGDFPLEHLLILESHYKKLTQQAKDVGTLDQKTEMVITDLCYYHAQKMKAIQEGDDSKKMSEINKMYYDTFKTLKLDRDTSKDNQSKADESWGMFNQIIENYSPADYYKDKSIYKDFDKREEYDERHLFRPLSNLVTGSSVMDEKYSISDNTLDDIDGGDEFGD